VYCSKLCRAIVARDATALKEAPVQQRIGGIVIGLFLLLVLVSPVWADTATLQWTPNAPTEQVTTYNVYRFLGSCATLGPVAPFASNIGNVTTYADTTIPSGTLGAAYAVTASNAGGESPKSSVVCKVFAAVPPPVVPLTVVLASPGGTTFVAPADGSELRTLITASPSREIVKMELSRDGGPIFRTITVAPWQYNLCVNCFSANEPLPRSMVLMVVVTASDGTVATDSLTLRILATAPPPPPPTPPTGLTVTQLTTDSILIAASSCASLSMSGTTKALTVNCVK
jgi:hypothetical protein